MLYYDFKLKGKEDFDVISPRDENFHDWTREKNNATEEQNRNMPYNVRFFIVDAKPECLRLCGIIGYKNKENPKKLALSFAKGIGFDATEVEGEEISIHTLGQFARQADQKCFIDDDDALLYQTSIGCRGTCTSNEYSEFLADPKYPLKKAKKKAEETNCGNSLLNEIDRIYVKQAQKTFVGNPVHYILYSDDWEVTKNIAHVLTSSLYANGRLKSRRVAMIKPKPSHKRKGLFDNDENLDMELVSSLYSSQQGCSFVVRLGKAAEENCIAKEEDFHVEQITQLLDENKVGTLSIVVLSKTEKKMADLLKIQLPKVRFVEIEEESFFTEKAVQIIRDKAKADNISNVGSLINKVSEEEKAFFISDVNRIYNEWLNDRLPVEVYPQYKDIKQTVVKLADVKGTAYQKLQSLIGLTEAKEVIQQALDFNKAQLYFDKAGLNDLKPARHMIFTGNPGTAKTTVARLFAQIMKDNGVLEKGDLIEVGRKDLVGKYVGWTAKLVEEAFQKAQGSVLFIDEAYSLCDDKSGLFGDEAINTIVQMMENQRNDTVVIFAGYPDKMEQFLDKNPGLRSRIAFHVNFDDYSTEELVQIFNLMAEENKVKLEEGVTDKLTRLFEDARNSKDFGNGRYARNIFEQARMKQATRIVHMNADEITDQTIRTLTVEDFSTSPVVKTTQESHVLGFAC